MPRTAPQESRNTGEHELDRLLLAVGHPLRRRILRALVSENSSAKVLAERFGAKKANVNYHLNQVLARECGVVRLVSTRPRRGGTEKIYTIHDKRLWAPALWQGLPPGPGTVMSQVSLRELLVQVLAAIEHGDPAVLAWQAAEVDQLGWQEIQAAADQFKRTVVAEIDRTRKQGARLKGIQTVTVITAISAFQPASVEAVDRWAHTLSGGS